MMLTNIQHLHDKSHTQALAAPHLTIQPQHPSHPLHKHTTSFDTPRLNNYFQQWPLDNKHSHRVTTTDINTNMHHIHTSIVSRHLHHTYAALKGYSHLSSHPLPISEQINFLSSHHTYTNSMPKHIHLHYALSVTSAHTTQTISSTAPLDFVGRPH